MCVLHCASLCFTVLDPMGRIAKGENKFRWLGKKGKLKSKLSPFISAGISTSMKHRDTLMTRPKSTDISHHRRGHAALYR